MARTKFGSIITDIRGSVGGHTFTNGSSGTFMRTKVRPAIRYSEAVMRQRACIAKLAYVWSTLTGYDLQSWFDRAPLYSFSNSLGKSYTISPYALFQCFNTPWVLAGKEPLRICLPPYAKDLTPYSVYVNSNGGCSFITTLEDEGNELFMVYCSQVFKRSERVSNIKWTLCDFVEDFIEGSKPLPVLQSYIQQQGWASGSKIKVELRYSQSVGAFMPLVKSFMFTLEA